MDNGGGTNHGKECQGDNYDASLLWNQKKRHGHYGVTLFRMRYIALLFFFTLVVMLGGCVYDFLNKTQIGRKAIARISERMSDKKYLISDISQVFDFSWKHVKIDYDLFYQNVFFDFFLENKETYEIAVSTNVLWVNENYAPMSPAGKSFLPNEKFLFFKSRNRFGSKSKDRITMESVSTREIDLCKKIIFLSKRNDRNLIKLKDLFPFQWSLLNVSIRHGYIFFCFDDEKKSLIMNYQFLDINIKEKTCKPDDLCAISKDQNGFLSIEL